MAPSVRRARGGAGSSRADAVLAPGTEAPATKRAVTMAARNGFALPPLSHALVRATHVLIERCLAKGMNQAEVAFVLGTFAGIEPLHADIVWYNLEASNPEFFAAHAAELARSDKGPCGGLDAQALGAFGAQLAELKAVVLSEHAAWRAAREGSDADATAADAAVPTHDDEEPAAEDEEEKGGTRAPADAAAAADDDDVAVVPAPATPPRTLDEAKAHSEEARVVTSVEGKVVTYVNDAWVKLCGYTAAEAVGKTTSELLQGPQTDHAAVRAAVAAVKAGAPEAEVVVTNLTKDRVAAIHRLRLSPLRNAETGDVTHFLGVLTPIAGAA